jgi:predicted patatin/cPLA2 family phospholipase
MTAAKRAKRGRPRKAGGAVSPAERMRAYRRRRRTVGIVVRRFSPEESEQWKVFKANAAIRRRLKQLAAQAQKLAQSYDQLLSENEQLKKALAAQRRPQKTRRITTLIEALTRQE